MAATPRDILERFGGVFRGPAIVAGPFSLADRMPPGKSLPLRPTISGLRSVRAPDLEAHAGPDIEPAYRVLTSMPAVTAEKTRTEGRLRSGLSESNGLSRAGRQELTLGQSIRVC